MKRKWHVWDFPDNIKVYIECEFRNELYGRLMEICGTRIEIARRLGVGKETIRRGLYLGKRINRLGIEVESYISVVLIKRIVKTFGPILGMNFLNRLEGNILRYRSWNGWDVKNPVMPLEESPELYSVTFHIVSDGNASKRHSPYYSNTSSALLEDFIKELQIFGKVEFHKKTREDGLVYVNFPKAITDILSHILKIGFVRPSMLPESIFRCSARMQVCCYRSIHR